MTQMYEIEVERDVAMRMRDGVDLLADIYTSAGDGPFPVLLLRSPYDKSTSEYFSLLRRPHDHHRDLRARLNAPHPSGGRNQDRHVIDDDRPLNPAECRSLVLPVLDRPRRRFAQRRNDASHRAPVFAARCG